MTTFFAVTYKGAVKTLNDKWPCLYTSRDKAKKDNPFNQPVVTVHGSDFDLDLCAIDHCWPKGKEIGL